ncbi:MAG: alpha-rhamnosidase [Ruminococcaceae bacterium]|nr:alpha-rhamnosidase [Oscillospiraceae bacterium]
MMDNAYWIWKRSDFENFHNLKMHSRRTEFGVEYPPFWRMTPPSVRLDFLSEYNALKDFTVSVAHTGIGYLILDERKMFDIKKEITLPSGEHRVRVSIQTDCCFPTIYINGEFLKTDSSWGVCEPFAKRENAAFSAMFDAAEKNPTVFPFEYERVMPIKAEKLERGIMYDFGKEVFCKVKLSNLNADEKTFLVYGESREEALDKENALIYYTSELSTSAEFIPSAFRYLYLECSNAQKVEIDAEFEFLPITDKAYFKCDNEFFTKIWDVCSYTFHLCNREFLIDGIKRDRWCWGGDAYESYLCDYYLFFDKESVTRTLNLLIGNGNFDLHVNTIPDYTALTVIGVLDYYMHTADVEYIKAIYPQLEKIYEYTYSRLNGEGFVDNFERDWIFIDWSDDLDKDGAMSAEQILLWKMNKAMAELADAIGEDTKKYDGNADELKIKIMDKFWRDDLGGFIDSYTSGNNRINRQANVFAIMFDFVDRTKKNIILNNVLLNDNVPPIVTPYFKFYELVALGIMGRIDIVQKEIENYWGGMLKLGATTIWEIFNPDENAAEHYAMYSKPFGRSLCHAWGGGPIYLLGRFCAGVYPTSAGYKTFRVEPIKGNFNNFEAVVPVNNGEVSVKLDEKSITVISNVDGGELLWDNQLYKIQKNITLSVNI